MKSNISKQFSYHLAMSVILGLLIVSCKTEIRQSDSDHSNQSPRIIVSSQEGSITYDSLTNSQMILIPGGTLSMGGDNVQASPNEYPKHQVKVDSFYMDVTEVTNSQFSQFVKESGYETVAERAIDWEIFKANLPPGTPRLPEELLQPGALVFKSTAQPVSLDNPAQWWHWTLGADWRHPTGPESNLVGKDDHPVVQIAWEDAVAYAKWAGKRLPTEAEWEWAARGGLEGKIYPWGDEDVNTGKPKANFWQGLFPFQNDLKDGYATTAPVGSFPANAYGLSDMSGNVWEWCSDWYGVEYYASSVADNPNGPDSGLNPSNPYEPHRVIRGGSYLCNDNYCSGYRNARRMGSSTDTGLSHTGFRCVRNTIGQ